MEPINKYLNEIAKACACIAKNDYTPLQSLEKLSIQGDQPEIITHLAENISFMILKLQGREYELEEARKKLERQNTQLKEKLRGLKIEIDRSKKSEEVTRIAKSEFFKKLKKAKYERKKRKP